MSYEYSESEVIDKAISEVLEDQGWAINTAGKKETFSESSEDRSDSLLGRLNTSEVLLIRDLLQALRMANPGLPKSAYEKAAGVLFQKPFGSLIEANQEIHQLLTHGVIVSYQDDNGETQSKRLKFFDFENSANNIFRAVRQLDITGELYLRRPDVIGFVNGIPLVLFEFNDSPRKLDDYKDSTPELMRFNATIVLCTAANVSIGTLSSTDDSSRSWEVISDGGSDQLSLTEQLRNSCNKIKLLDLFESFIVFSGIGNATHKLIIRTTQLEAVNKAFDRAQTSAKGIGLIGEAQGYNLSMYALCQKILRKRKRQTSFLIVSDRIDLENQSMRLFQSFYRSWDLQQASSREHLCQLLESDRSPFIFTLLQKFKPSSVLDSEEHFITERDDIIVVMNSPHSVVFGAQMDALYKALPNVRYLGFTTAPSEKVNEATKKFFGEYIS